VAPGGVWETAIGAGNLTALAGTPLAQVSNGLVRNQAVLLIVGLVIVLVIGGVIFPAVWSSKRTRRTAALNVLDRILRWRR
jgi:hypothetical protein